MAKKQNLTQFIQIRVSSKEKAFIQLLAKKHSSKAVSSYILSLLYSELNTISVFDPEINEAKKDLMKG